MQSLHRLGYCQPWIGTDNILGGMTFSQIIQDDLNPDPSPFDDRRAMADFYVTDNSVLSLYSHSHLFPNKNSLSS